LSGDQPATLAKKSASKNKAQSKQPAKKKNNADSKSSKTATKKTANAN
jgi:hypothetical protein